MLGRTDFWFTTAIVFVETARIVGYNSAPEAKFFVDALAVFSKKNVMRAGSTTNFIRLVAMVPTWIALAPIFVASACMSLSIARLVGIARHPYGGPSTGRGPDSSNGNLMPALMLFYALVLTQGLLFVLWSVVAMNRSAYAKDLSGQFLGANDGSRSTEVNNQAKTLIDRYVNSIAATCIEKGVSATINSTLVSFAADLLQSQLPDPDDIVSAVSMLHWLVIGNKESAERAVEQICSSDKYAPRLVRLLRSKDLDLELKSRTAEIVAKLARRLRLADMPGAAQCISSLLDPRYLVMQQKAATKSLVILGLVILGELAADPDNRMEIYSTTDLVPKIMEPVRNGLHMAIGDYVQTVEIVKGSLRVLDKLTSGTGESCTRLRRDLVERYGRAAENILWILSNSERNEFIMPALKILSRLTLGRPSTLEFVGALKRLFFEDALPISSSVRIAAGRTLDALVTRYRGHEFDSTFPDIIQQLLKVTIAEEYDREYRAVTAGTLAHICAKSRTQQDRNRLCSVASALPTVLKAIVTETTNISEPGTRKFLTSFLGLAVQILEKLATAEDLVNAVAGLPMGANSFLEKLKAIIIETTNDGEDEVFLATMKVATKLVTWMMGVDIGYVHYFQQANIVDKLNVAVDVTLGLERYVVMTGGANQMEGYYETLATLVEAATKILVPSRSSSINV